MKTTFIFAFAATLAGGAIFAPASAGAPQTTHPNEARTLAGALAAEPSLTTFTRLVRAAGLEDMLKEDGPYTVLAPNDAAFRMMPKSDLEKLQEPENRDRLVQMLTYHIVPGSIPLPSISTEEYVTLQGSSLVLNRDGDTVWADRAEVVKRDIDGGREGIIHTINMVLEPDQQ